VEKKKTSCYVRVGSQKQTLRWVNGHSAVKKKIWGGGGVSGLLLKKQIERGQIEGENPQWGWNTKEGKQEGKVFKAEGLWQQEKKTVLPEKTKKESRMISKPKKGMQGGSPSKQPKNGKESDLYGNRGEVESGKKKAPRRKKVWVAEKAVSHFAKSRSQKNKQPGN